MNTPRVSAILAAWVDLMTRRAVWVVLFGVVLTLLAGGYAATHLSMDTDDADLISKQVDWRQTYIAYQDAFPVYTDNLVIVVDGANAGVASAATKRLAAALHDQPDLFTSVYEPGGGAFFAQNGLLYLDTPELADLADRLNRLQPFLGRLATDPTLPTFFDLLDQAMAPDAPVDLNLTPVFSELHSVFKAANNDVFGQLSWQQLIGGDQPGVSDRRFIIAKPKLDYGRLLPAEPAMQAVEAAAAGLDLNEAHGATVRQTGEVALSDEELESVTQGAAWGAALALTIVAILLYIGLRSWRLMGVSLVSLIAGLVGTAAFAALAVGRLNLISIAFAVLYIGLGIDYAIHVCLRYREALGEFIQQAGAALEDRAGAVRRALSAAIGDVGISLVLCAVTTAAGFFAFLPTSYSGVAELGLISGAGMFISLVVSLTFLPAAVSLVRPWTPTRADRASKAPYIGRRAQRMIWAVALVATVASAAALPFVSFNPSALDLKNPNAESVKTYRDLLATSDRSPLTLVATRDSLDAANTLAERIAGQPHVSSAITVADYIPTDQDDKLAIIGDLALTLALMSPDMSQPAAPADQRGALDSFAQSLADYRARQSDPSPAAKRLANALARWQQQQSGLTAEQQSARLTDLRERILSGLPRQIDQLSASLSASRVTLANLPADLRQRWVSSDGVYRVEVTPKGDLSQGDAMAQFVNSVQAVAPDITGAPVLELSAGATVSHAFVMAFIYAGVFITLFLLVLLRSLVDTLRVLAPLALSGLILAAATVWFGLPFNFANVIALPLLLGVGVDSGIHVVHRLRGHSRSRAFLATSTARAVLLSSATTMAGFGSLAFSHHAGTASMGLLLTIGMLAILATTLILVPALFPVEHQSEDVE